MSPFSVSRTITIGYCFIATVFFILMIKTVYSQDDSDYFNLFRDLHTLVGKNHRDFEFDFQLDKRTGDLSFFIRGKSDKQVELNLQYNFKDENVFCSEASAFEYRKNGQLNEINAYTVTHPPTPKRDYSKGGFTIEDLQRDFFFHKPDEPGNDVLKPPVLKPRGTIQLTKGDMFSRTAKVWDMKIWDTIVNTLEEDKTIEYSIHLGVVIKIEDKFYKPQGQVVMLDYKTVNAMKRIKIAHEKKIANPPPNDNEPIEVEIQMDESLKKK
jgi:hypothetical protein